MAVLQITDVVDILKSGRDSFLEKAEYHENRICMHSLPTDKEPKDNPAFLDWKSTIKERLDETKFYKFWNLIPYPLPTVDFVGSVNAELKKVFEAQDTFKQITLKSPSLTQEAKEKISETDDWLKNEAFETMEIAINSIQFTDLPVEQEGKRPEPYTYFIPISNVRNIKVVHPLNPVEYIAFYTGEEIDDKKVIVFADSGYYRKFLEWDSDTFEELGFVEHDISFCPAKPFWSTKFNKKEDLVRAKSVFSTGLGKLDSFLWKDVSKDHSDLYMLHPPMWSLPGETNHKEESEGDDVNHDNNQWNFSQGQLYSFTGNSYENISYTPGFGSKKFTGAGVHLTKPMPDIDNPDTGPPAGYIEANPSNIKEIREDLELFKDNLYKSFLGVGTEIKNDQAKNEKQIRGGFESRDQVLKNVKFNFEQAAIFKMKCECALKYGADQIEEISYNLGTQMSLQTEDQLKDSYGQSKKIGLPSYFMAQERNELSVSKYKNNPNVLSRMQILKNVDPFPNISQDKVIDLLGKTIINDELLLISIYFDKLVNQFEAEISPIEAFAPDSPLSVRVELIQRKFKEYITKGSIYGDYTKERDEGQEAQTA